MSTEKRSYRQTARAEAADDTRRRIVEATVALHQAVGPARTTMAAIAERAGVNRATIYNHFPDDGALFAACQRRFLDDHPLPDLDAALALTEPTSRVRAVLAVLYGSYREREPMTAKVLRDRAVVPALDALLGRTIDAQQASLVHALSAGYRVRGQALLRVRAVVAVALDFWTWRRLSAEGLGGDAAAALMAELVRAAGR